MTSRSATESGRRVVVGVAPSAAGRAAVRFAARTAADQEATLDLVRVWRDVDWFFSMTVADVRALADGERADRALLQEAVELARATAPTVAVVEDFASGDLYDDLLARTADAVMLVLGADDPTNPEAAAGSIDDWFHRHAHCPVIVVDPDGAVLGGDPVSQP